MHPSVTLASSQSCVFWDEDKLHRDIKGSNILLDKDLNPKIDDFGLALLFPSLDDGETHMSISKIA